MKLLLTSVFGPYGVNSEFDVKDNKMELFHNQVTREQGIYSYRFHHASNHLNFMATNVKVPTVILDFPTIKRFKKEIKKNYQYIGISFIIPNIKKVIFMTQMIRKYSPKTKIILGGHGVNVPNLKNMLKYDYICKGEGVRFLRKLFNEDVDAPIKHPIEYSSYNRRVMGVPWPSDSGILFSGVGCPNKCRFCATSHFFGEYSSFLKTGQEIFDVCCEYQEKLGVVDFGVYDENFLKMKDRALELIDIMEREKKFFSFAIFSSAETLIDLGDLDILVRLGVRFIWIGVESKKEFYEKNKGIDFHKLFFELQRRGISIMASTILFSEHHTKETIWEDINYVTSLKPDYLQFMQLGPIPGTKLYDDYHKEDKLLFDIPFIEQHGQGKIWFKHPHFTREDSEEFLIKAFKTDYIQNGPSMLRAFKTYLKGYIYSKNHSNEFVRLRSKGHYTTLKFMRYFLFSMSFFKENNATKILLKEVKKLFNENIKVNRIKTKFLSLIVFIFGIKEYLRIKLFGDSRQPSTLLKKFNSLELNE